MLFDYRLFSLFRLLSLVSVARVLFADDSHDGSQVRFRVEFEGFGDGAVQVDGEVWDSEDRAVKRAKLMKYTVDCEKRRKRRRQRMTQRTMRTKDKENKRSSTVTDTWKS